MTQEKVTKLLPLTENETDTLRVVLEQITSNTQPPSNFDGLGFALWSLIMSNLKTILEKMKE